MTWRLILVLWFMILTAAATPVAADEEEDLAKQAQNPIADMISLPLQNNTSFNYGPLDRAQNVLYVQPVYPFSLNEKWNVITRTIIPLVWEPTLSTWNPPFTVEKDSSFGIGNTTFVPYFSPKNSGQLGEYQW